MRLVSTVMTMREELAAIWARSNATREQLLAQLHDWIARAEQSGIQQLQEFSQRLRRYAVNRWQRNARVQARSTRNGRIFHATGPVRWARDWSLKLLGERVLDVPWLYRGDGGDASRS